MNSTSQKLLLWVGIALAVLYFIGFAVLMGFFPPLKPSLGAAEVAAYYTQNNQQFRIDIVLMIIAAGYSLPWVVVTSVQLARYEKGVPIWAITQGVAGTLGVILFFLPPVLWGVAAFTPERDPGLTLLMHELASLMFFTPVSLFPFQTIAIAVVALSAKQDEFSPFPRWMGFFSVWMAVTAEAGVCAMLFKWGPFAWDGLFVFYLPLGVFGVWITTLLMLMLGAIGRQQRAGLID